LFCIDARAGQNAFDLFKRHQEQTLTVKANDFTFHFAGFDPVLTFDYAGGAQRKLQARGFQHQACGAG
jgi:hypothetical protein